MHRTIQRFKTPLGFRKDGRPIFPIAGASDDDSQNQGGGGDGGNDGGNDDGNTGGGDGQSGSDGGQHVDLFGDGSEGNGDGSGGETITMSKADLESTVADVANRIADKRINQALQTRKRKTGGGKQQHDQGDDDTQAVSDSDVREARIAYRDYVADSVKFVSAEERALGTRLAAAFITDSLSGGADVDRAGSEAAQQVSDLITSLRSTYQNRTISALKQRGVIPEDYQPQQSTRSTAGKQSGSPGDPQNPAMNGDYGRTVAQRLFPQQAANNNS